MGRNQSKTATPKPTEGLRVRFSLGGIENTAGGGRGGLAGPLRAGQLPAPAQAGITVDEVDDGRYEIPPARKKLIMCSARLWASLLLGTITGGCTEVDPTVGYTSRSLYRTDVKTVFVEMFESQSFRREIEFELTRAVCEQLELHSPYKVVSDRSRADTVLYGSIERVAQHALAQQRELDRPVAGEVTLVVVLNWKDLRTGQMLIDAQELRFSGNYAPFLGTGPAAAAREAAHELGIRIAEALEAPW